jgi:Co/Zn/Cd efflux system component
VIRVQVLAGFANAVVLVFVALNICLEASVHLMEGGHDVMTHRLLPVSVAGLAVNVLGLAFAHEAHQHGPGECHLSLIMTMVSFFGPINCQPKKPSLTQPSNFELNLHSYKRLTKPACCCPSYASGCCGG